MNHVESIVNWFRKKMSGLEERVDKSLQPPNILPPDLYAPRTKVSNEIDDCDDCEDVQIAG